MGEDGAAINAAVLSARRILITGASGHLGLALSAALRAEGATVIGLARRGGDDVVSCDVTDEEAVPVAVEEAVRRLGGLDTVIHCAGIGGPGAIGPAPTRDDHETLEVNLWGAWRVTSAALPALVEARGRVVFTSSLMAYAATPFARSYAVSKRALSAYADSLRNEYGSHLLVTTVYPGHFDTGMHEKSRAMGLSMDDKIPHEQLEDIVRVMVEVVASERPPIDCTTALVGEAGFQLSRRLPGAGATLINRRTRELTLNGELDGVDAAAEMRRLFADSAGLRQDVMTPEGLTQGIRASTRLVGDLLQRSGVAAIQPVWGMLAPLLEMVANTIDAADDGPAAKVLGLSESELDGLRTAGAALAGQLMQALFTPPPEGTPSMLDPRVLALVMMELQAFVDRTSHKIASEAAGEADSLRS